MSDHKKSKYINSNSVSPEQTIDEQRRRFLLNSVRVLGGVGALCALTPFIASWSPSDTVKAAGGPVQVDLSHLEPGQQITVEWRGKPVWILRRTSDMIQQLQTQQSDLRDPDSRVPQQPHYAQNQYRSIKPEYLVLVGLCTHLGCSPKLKSQDSAAGPNKPGGYYCPCHGSRFDLAGRVYKGVPAPINMEVPPHRFIDDHIIEIGEAV